MIGYKRFHSLDGFTYPEIEPQKSKKSEVKTPADVVLDNIFCRDEFGWPQSSLAVYLGEKTPADVKAFIEQNLLTINDQHAITDEKVVAEFKNLSDEFIAQASRNRYESVEDYEARLQSIISDDDRQASFRARSEALSKLLNAAK